MVKICLAYQFDVEFCIDCFRDTFFSNFVNNIQ